VTSDPDNDPDARYEARRTAFGRAAADYASGRPPYPEAAIDDCMPAGATAALDLAAGTGILTAALLSRGLDVTAVEPSPEMRGLVPAPARAVDGTAESIPLPDASVDVVVVGQAWHWFDPPRALDEIARVLRPTGTLSLMWNLFDASDPLSDTVSRILSAEERTDMMLDDQDPPYQHAGFSAPTRRVYHHAPTYDVDRLLAFAASRSQTILADPTQRADMLAQLRAAAPTGEFPLAMVCEMWQSHRLG
jgi:SAM-dependent methyltransferase